MTEKATFVAIGPRQPLPDQCINKLPGMLSGFLGYVFSMRSDHFEESIDSMPSVKELPQTDTGGVQAETVTAVGVEENGPVVELLPEQDEGISLESVTIVHAPIFPSV